MMAVLMGSVSFAQFKVAPKVDNMETLRPMTKAPYYVHWEQIAAPFTANDLRTGESISLQSYLDAGKFVVIDYSATWCGPCWNLHTSGLLEQLNALPDFQVIWVESESTNTLEQIYGTTTAQTYAGYTCGNWVDPHGDGTPVPFPMIDDDAQGTCNATCANLNDYYVPLLILIAPNGQACNLRGLFSASQVDLSLQLIQFVAASYPQAGQEPQCYIDGPETCFTGSTVNFTALYNSIDPVTSISWSTTDGTPTTGSGENFSCTFNTDGDHMVILSVTNANGTARDTLVLSSSTAPSNVLSYTYGMEAATGIGTGQASTIYWAVSYPAAMTANHGSVEYVECYVSAEYPGNYTMTVYSGSLSTPQTSLGSATVNVTASMGDDYVRFTPASPIAIDHNKTLWIVMSATAEYPAMGCAAVGEANSDWISTDGSSYSHASAYDLNYSWLIDTYTSNGVGINSVLSGADVQVAPNPATDRVRVKAEGLRYVEVIDLEGRVVMTNRTSNVVDLSAVNAGVYVFRVVTDNGTSMHKVVKK